MKLNTQDSEYKIEIVDSPLMSEEYKAFREKIWNQMVEEGKKVGKEFYNGKICRLVAINEETRTIQLGTMQYADRLLKTRVSLEDIGKRFGKDHIMQHCIVNAILLTSDKKVVVGVKKTSINLLQGILAYVGGNLSPDEVEVKNFEDIYTMMMTEIEEETSIIPQREKLSFSRLVANGNFASFYFTYQLDISSKELDIIFREGEFVKFEALTQEEIVNTERAGVADFDESKEWVGEMIGWV